MTYPQELEAAWLAHLTPRQPGAPTMISLFAGCGGSSLGYSMAGFQERLAVEWNKQAAETFRLNFPEVPLYEGDVRNLSVEEALTRTNLEPGQLDVLDGSPPCQGFSVAGKRQFSDKRNQLFQEYVRLLRGFSPKTFVMENVPGMAQGRMKPIFVHCLEELREAGYRVKARILNAMYFGVPQARERLIFMGIRNDLGIEPSHPLPQTIPISMYEALSGLSSHCDAPALTPRYQTYWQAVSPGKTIGKFASTKKLKMHSAALTLTADESKFHPYECRGLSTAEYKRLGSFPDAFQFLGRPSAIVQIGNSVPPFFMRAVALHLRTSILDPHP